MEQQKNFDQQQNSIMLYKLNTGELIIGELEHALTVQNQNSNTLFIKNPALVGLMDDSIVFRRYNFFSKMNLIMLMSWSIVYIDVPSKDVVEYYKQFLKMDSSSTPPTGNIPNPPSFSDPGSFGFGSNAIH